MSYSNTENFYSEFSTKTHSVNGQFSSTGTSNGVFYRQTLTFQLGAKVTKIFLNYTNSGVDFQIEIVSTRVWLKLEHKIWATETITVTITADTSLEENEKGSKKSLVPQSFIAELLVGLHNKDPPYLL